MENSDLKIDNIEIKKIESKRCPKCFHDTLQFDMDKKRFHCTNCGYSVDLASYSSLTGLKLDDKK